MKNFNKIYRLSTIGMAMFNMFFGAGNIVFPLMIGQMTQDKSPYALLGLLLTAVAVPFIGLIGMALFGGNYRLFFSRLGPIPGSIVIALIMGLIGPFGATPRCIALSYSTTTMFFSGISLPLFSLLFCIGLYFLTIRKEKLTNLIGPILTPFLLVTIAIIVIKGLFTAPDTIATTNHTQLTAFFKGLHSGYQTMDLIGAFIFGSIVVNSLHSISTSVTNTLDKKQFIKNTIIASAIGALLLATVYVGMSMVAAKHGVALSGVPAEALLGTIAIQVLGPFAGVVTCAAVVIACATTAMALVSIFAEFLSTSLQRKISYNTSLIITLIIAFFISTLEFGGIFKMLAPIVEVIYPLLLVLCVVNIVSKLRQPTLIYTHRE